jgi:formate hydrogenlyase transcriptional activator
MFDEIVGSSAALRRVLSQAEKVARTDSTVLILGETGTGKELIARAIYKRSARSTRAFIRVNCAAIPASLIASELFGHDYRLNIFPIRIPPLRERAEDIPLLVRFKTP